MRLLRFSRRTPSRFSTYVTCLLTIAVERSMRSAAATKLPDSTTCRNTRMLVSVSTRIVYVRRTLRGPRAAAQGASIAAAGTAITTTTIPNAPLKLRFRSVMVAPDEVLGLLRTYIESVVRHEAPEPAAGRR